MWKKLYNAALKVQNARVISPFIEAGGVAAGDVLCVINDPEEAATLIDTSTAEY